MIDDLTIRKIKEAASIVDVVGDFYQLKKRGIEYTCLCPFHDDKHLGSFMISEKKNIAKCFSCDWQGGPIDFLMEHEHLSFPDALRWLGKKYCIEVEGADEFIVKPSIPREQQPKLPMLVLPDWMVRIREHNDDNTLVRWIRSLKWDATERHRIDEMLKAYRVGTSKNGMTIWWLIDEKQQVRTGKMMMYRPDGHRDKESKYNFDWIHSALYRDQRNEFSADKTDMKSCLFGLHLLDAYKRHGVRQDVCIVESEKTALLMAIAYGNHAQQVWMACGGLGNINTEKLAPIINQGRKILLFPDRDGVDEWKMRAESIQYDNIHVMTDAVLKWWKPCDGEKADVADVVIRMLGERKTYHNIGEIINDYPQIKQLATNFQLELDNATGTR